MRALHAVSYAFQVLWREWRVWLVLAWLPALGAIAEPHLWIASFELTDPGPSEKGVLQAALATLVVQWGKYIFPMIAGLFFIPALTAFYRHLLRSNDDSMGGRLRVGRAEFLYLGYHLLFAVLAIILWNLLFNSTLGSIKNEYVFALHDFSELLFDWGTAHYWAMVDSFIYPIILLLLGRFLLVLPDAAIGRRSSFWTLWRRSRGHLLAIVLALAVMLAFGGLVGEAAVAVPQMMLNELVFTHGVEAPQVAWKVEFWQYVYFAGEFAGDYLHAVGTAAVLAWFYRDLVLSRET